MATKEKNYEEAVEALGVNENMSTEEEFDLISGFMKASELITENTKKVEIRDNGELLFAFRIHAVTAEDIKVAKKKATTFMPNPVNKKLPPIEKDVDKVTYQSFLIYLATVEEDKTKIWENPALMSKFGVMEGYELIDKVIPSGKKQQILTAIDILSGYDDEEPADDIDTAKNS